MRVDEVENDGDGVLWTTLLFFFSIWRWRQWCDGWMISFFLFFYLFLLVPLCGSSTRFSLSCSSSVRFSLHTLCFFLGLCLCSFFFFVCSFCVLLVFVHMFFLRSSGYSFSPLRVPLCVCSSSALWFSRLCSLFFFSPSRPSVFSSFGFLCFFRPVLDCEGRLGFCYRSSGKKLKSPSGFFGLFPSLCFHPSSVAFLWECHAVTQTKKRTCRTITVVTEMHRGRGVAGRDTVHEWKRWWTVFSEKAPFWDGNGHLQFGYCSFDLL